MADEIYKCGNCSTPVNIKGIFCERCERFKEEYGLPGKVVSGTRVMRPGEIKVNVINE